MERVASHPVSLEGNEFVVAGTARFGVLKFWVEGRDGSPRLTIVDGAPPASRIFDPLRQVIARTGGPEGARVRSLGLASGWFEPTGIQLNFPLSQINEVWTILPAAVAAFKKAGVNLAVELSQPPPAPSDLASLMEYWMERLSSSHVGAIVVTVPNPFSATRGARFVVSTYPESLRKSAQMFESPGAPTGRPALAEWGHLAEHDGRPWAKLMIDKGFQSVIATRMPTGGDNYIESLMFGAEPLYDHAQAAIAVWSALDVAPVLKEATASVVCNLTPRERECLLQAFEGKSADETAQVLGISERTVQFHLSKVIAKLRATGKPHAVHRALMLGII